MPLATIRGACIVAPAGTAGLALSYGVRVLTTTVVMEVLSFVLYVDSIFVYIIAHSIRENAVENHLNPVLLTFLDLPSRLQAT